ncbi:hypothetical protein [Variovorax sp.]|uniref:hypothetical protein n=1 Tax=Variovorax sp. TaxID=1871043 RepID=UPI003BAAAF24
MQHWLLGMALLCAGVAAGAQPGPSGQIARLNQQQGTVSVALAGQDRWQAARQGGTLSVGDRVWTDRNARAEFYIGPVALRLGSQTQVEFSGLDANFVDITTTQGELQLRVRDGLAGQRLKIHTGNLHAVITAPGEYRFAADTATSTTWVAVTSGQLTLYGKNGASQLLTDRQQTTVSGRDLTAVATTRVQNAGFDAWVAERNRIEERSSGTARFGPPGVPVPSAVLAVPPPQVRYEPDYRAQQEQQLAWQREQDWRQQQEQEEFRRQEDLRREQEWRQQEDWRQQREWQQRRDWRQQRAEQDRWQQQQQQQQALRQQQEMQLRAAQAQAMQQQQLLQQQQRAAQQAAQAQQQQLQARQQQEMQLRALQMQQQVQAQQAAQQNALRQAQEAQLRAIQQQQRGMAATQQQQQGQSEDLKRLWTSPDSR